MERTPLFTRPTVLVLFTLPDSHLSSRELWRTSSNSDVNTDNTRRVIAEARNTEAQYSHYLE